MSYWRLHFASPLQQNHHPQFEVTTKTNLDDASKKTMKSLVSSSLQCHTDESPRKFGILHPVIPTKIPHPVIPTIPEMRFKNCHLTII